MTPEEARALEPGTTPGPWNVYSSEALGGRITTEIGPIAPRCHCDGLECGEADARLIAATPDMRTTIAEMRWEYGVEDAYGVTAWMACDYPEGAQDSETEAREYLSTFGPDSIARLVRRPVGDVEVVE